MKSDNDSLTQLHYCMNTSLATVEIEKPQFGAISRSRQKSQETESSNHIDQLFIDVKLNDSYDSFKELYTSLYNKVLFFARKYMDSIESSEEVVSEVFLKIWKKRNDIQINSSFQSYLYTAVKNKCLDFLRKEGNRKFEDESALHMVSANHSNTLEIIHSDELYTKIEAAINQLPKDRRRVFLMSRTEGLKYKEIADKLGISIKTVETQMGRSLKFLREQFKNELAEFYS